MTVRFFISICTLLVTGLCALSLGGRVFYLASWALILMMAYSLISLVLARRLLELRQQADDMKVERGASSNLLISVRMRSLLPIAPLELHMDLPDGRTTMLLDAGMKI